MSIKLLFILGTRPEAIKLAPLILKSNTADHLDVKVCVTGQHRQMLKQVVDFFNLTIDYDLNLMKRDQSLFDITADALKALKPLIEKEMPDVIVVQGDTTTAFAGALSGFYKKIKVVHIEAGLRSHRKYSPFPEEINRILISRIANYHFAPSETAKNNLLNEGIKKNIYVVGNTAIDALLLGTNIIKANGDKIYREFFHFLDFSKKIILVTGHRRENFGNRFENICKALEEIAALRKDVQIIYPVHLNPHVRETAHRMLGNLPGIFLIEPLEYQYMIWLMNKSFLVLTDSGGIQEEAPFLGKPVIVMRNSTERTEAIEAGASVLVGADKNKIVKETINLLTDKTIYENMSKPLNLYGDGKSSEKIINILLKKAAVISKTSHI